MQKVSAITPTNQQKENAREMIVNRYEQRVVWQAILAEYQKNE
jgi:hypothetical protein